ncbi:MAG TPA: prepilin peptidase [Bacteroidia bacterium]|jgi:hypothetical protein|nr:prepilin peptidase [Bacteroidia bacterium]
MVLKVILFLFLFLCSIIVSYQDFKDRLISLWAILLYAICCIASVLLFQDTTTLISNSISTSLYFVLVFGALFLYYFIREGKFVNIIDSKIGLGDILIFIAIGLTLDLFYLIIFFTISFCIAAVVALFLAKQNKTVPLAGILVWCYFFFRIGNQISIL